MKTGYTKLAGYNLTATAKRDNMRLISVVMGEETSEARSKDTIELLDYGFNNYKLKTIYDVNSYLGKVKVNNGKNDYIELKLVNDVTDLISIEKDPKYDYKLKINEVTAPVNVGDIVGKLELFKDGKKYKEFDITVKKSLKKANMWDMYKKNFKYLVSGNI